MSSFSVVQTTSPVVLALDYAHASDALALVDQLEPGSCRLKIGKELFTVAGPSIVRDVQTRGFEVFLDLKFHDIPNTVASAVAAAADLGVWMVNVHASGGRRMMEAAAARLQQGAYATQLIAVTVLTSMEQSDLTEIGVDATPLEHVTRLAALTADCGLHGVVCSAQEASLLRQQRGNDFLLVTPGIRPAQSEVGDQRRVMTPVQARDAGVSYMVIGRPITQAANPAQALAAIHAELGITPVH